jgi:hypothetical protein
MFEVSDFKLRPCYECCVLSLGDSLALELYGLTFWNTLVCSLFIGGVSRKNNWDEIARVFFTGKG